MFTLILIPVLHLFWSSCLHIYSHSYLRFISWLPSWLPSFLPSLASGHFIFPQRSPSWSVFIFFNDRILFSRNPVSWLRSILFSLDSFIFWVWSVCFPSIRIMILDHSVKTFSLKVGMRRRLSILIVDTSSHTFDYRFRS